MAVIITCGLRQEWCDFGQSRINEMGVTRALKAERVDLGADELLRKMCKSTKTSVERSKTFRQVRPGKTWQILAADLFLENSDNEAWGWANPNNIFFLDFWREFDPECRFVLVYGSLAQYAAFEMTDQGSFQSNIKTAISRWENYHTELMRFYHENEEQCILVNIERFDQSAREIARGLKEKFSIETRLINTNHSLDISPFKSLAAETLLKENIAFLQIFPELENSADIPSEYKETEAELTWRALESYDAALEEARQAAQALLNVESRLTEKEAWFATELEGVNKIHEAKIKDLDDAIASANEELSTARLNLSNALEIAQKHEISSNDFEAELMISRNQLVDYETEIISMRKQSLNVTSSSEQDSNNELLLLQLTQVQEELNYYFEKYNALSGIGHQNITPPKYTQPFKTKITETSNEAFYDPNRPSEWVVDLRKYVNGEGWHNPEMDGRWAGLDRICTVKIRALNQAPHKIVMTVINAMSLHIVDNMIFKFEGKVLKPTVQTFSHLTGSLASLRRIKASITRSKNPYPITFSYEVSADLIHGTGKGHWIEITVPETVSPAEQGLNDFRDLSICVETIKVTRLDKS